MRRVGIHGAGVIGISQAVNGALGGGLPCYYLTFDGGNDLITLAGITLTPPFTLVAWTKRRVAGAFHPILADAAWTQAWYLLATDHSRLVHGTNTTGNINASLLWVHRAVVAPVAANAIPYDDGVDVTLAANIPAGARLYDRIGGSPGLPAYFDGQIAVFGIAPAVLNIPALWAAGTLHRPLDPAVFTTACWNGRQEGGAGTALIDEAIGNDGTFLGAGEPAWGGLMAVGGPAGWSDS
jgi:hypothetical protein